MSKPRAADRFIGTGVLFTASGEIKLIKLSGELGKVIDSGLVVVEVEEAK